ncbi:MAG TPA: type II toxin-antitoxin system Phd/YefM family antitoxin, partial [Anaerovoracaceae bacterium]|nr:type II toxin-antitoxin system Phd/YefM family antitoxin [Anaerovoracaceae bacterium]
LRKNLFEYLNLAIDFNDVINVNTRKGNVIILSEQEYNGLMETLYLTSIPGMKERLTEGLKAKPEDCVDFEW